MGTVIVVEGADRLGKTTAIDAIAKNAADPCIVKFTGPPAGADSETGAQLMLDEAEHFYGIASDLSAVHDYVILDRSHVGEAVYGPLFERGKPDWLRGFHRKFNKKFRPIYFLISGKPYRPEPNPVLAEHDKEIQDGFKEFFAENKQKVLAVNNVSCDHLPLVLQKFAAAETFGEEAGLYDYTMHSPRLGSYIPKHPWARPHACAGGWSKPIAAQMPPVWNCALFGEAPGYKGCGITGIPFTKDRSGTMLRQIFYNTGVNLDFMYVSNVLHTTPPVNNSEAFRNSKALDEYEFNAPEKYAGPSWIGAELTMFKEEVIEAVSQSKDIISCGRVANNWLTKANSELDLGAKIIHIRHPASFLYEGNADKAEGYYKAILKDAWVV